MSIANTEYPSFVKLPLETVSNWQSLEFPKFDALRGRILFQILDKNGSPADPLLLQVPGAYGFIAPQGYSVHRVHFCNGIAIGAWIKSPSISSLPLALDKSLIYVQSRTLDVSVQDQMLDLVRANPLHTGEFGFGSTSAGVVNNKLQIRTNGYHTTVQGPITAKPNTVVMQVETARFEQPTFTDALLDGSELLGVFKVFSDIVYVYSYTYDMMALARIYAVDGHKIIQESIRILNASAPETVITYQQQFRELVLDCFDGPVSGILKPEQQAIAQANATDYINGTRVFNSLVIQGEDDVKPRMNQICMNPAFQNTPICSCYQTAVSSCLNPICQQIGYKSKDLKGIDCKTELQGTQINVQTCIAYQQLIAGGSISGSSDVQSYCQQNSPQIQTQLPIPDIRYVILFLLVICGISVILYLIKKRKARHNSTGLFKSSQGRLARL